MDEFVYNSVYHYFTALDKLGHYKQEDVNKLLILLFFYNFTTNDYRGNISKEDYAIIEKALYCLYGTSCLIPYPDYLKMGDLHLGDLSEVVTRIKNIENTKVIKSKQDIREVEDIEITPQNNG